MERQKEGGQKGRHRGPKAGVGQRREDAGQEEEWMRREEPALQGGGLSAAEAWTILYRCLL